MYVKRNNEARLCNNSCRGKAIIITNLEGVFVDLGLQYCNAHASYEGWNFNSGNYLFTTDTKYIHVSKFYCPSV